MKKIVAILLSAMLVFSLAACSSSSTAQGSAGAAEQDDEASSESGDDTERETADSDTETLESPDSTDASVSAGKPLVIYFSRTGEQYGVGVIDKGNTEIVAEIIAEETGADLYQILPAEDYYPYTYDELTDIAKQEQNENARPAYAGDAPDISKYDTIYIGAPVWWGDWPMIMYTFFEANEEGLSGKTLAPFSTHAGSGLSGFDTKLQSAIPMATVTDGLAIRGSDAQDNQDSVRSAVQDWIVGLGL